MNKNIALILMSVAVVAAAGCKRKERIGACVFDYDDLGGKGTACTIDSEARCKAGDEPPIRAGGLTTLTLKTFTEGKTCGAVGYTTSGCSDVPIAWVFSGKCPL